MTPQNEKEPKFTDAPQEPAWVSDKEELLRIAIKLWPEATQVNSPEDRFRRTLNIQQAFDFCEWLASNHGIFISVHNGVTGYTASAFHFNSTEQVADVIDPVDEPGLAMMLAAINGYNVVQHWKNA